MIEGVQARLLNSLGGFPSLLALYSALGVFAPYAFVSALAYYTREGSACELQR